MCFFYLSKLFLDMYSQVMSK